MSKDDFGVIADSPERIDINFLNHNSTDWLHFNGVDYNAEFDQIILSVHNFSEFWIIDHSTTLAEATGSTGGTFGQGGDILYRWGNPQAYDQGGFLDQKLHLQHHTHWIPAGLPDEGKIILFSNQVGSSPNYSTVNIVDLPVDQNGFYSYSGGSYGQTDFDWTYQASTPSDFYSNIISGAERLENGNTLICEGVGGRFFEIDTSGTTVWEYINPVNDLGPMAQNTVPSSNNVFRCSRYTPDYSGLSGQTLTPQGYIETGSTFTCDLYPSTANIEIFEENSIQYFPNPTSDQLTIQGVNFSQKTNVTLINLLGARKSIDFSILNEREILLDLNELENSVYFIQLDNGTTQNMIKVTVNNSIK